MGIIMIILHGFKFIECSHSTVVLTGGSYNQFHSAAKSSHEPARRTTRPKGACLPVYSEAMTGGGRELLTKGKGLYILVTS